VAFCKNFILATTFIQNISFFTDNYIDLIVLFDFQNIELLTITELSLINNQFKNSSFLRTSVSVLSLQNSDFINNFFIITNGILIFESNSTFQNLTIQNNSLDQSLFSITNIISSNNYEFLNISSNQNKGQFLISFNSDNLTPLINIPSSFLIISEVSFNHEVFSSSIILLSNLNSLNISNLMFSSCSSPKNLQLYNLETLDFSYFNCFNNIGSCLLMSLFSTFQLQDSQIFNCSSILYTPGLLIENSDSLIGQISIIRTIFSLLSFNSAATDIEYLGCALYITNVLSLTIETSYFSNNSLQLTNNIYGGPSLVFFNIEGSVLIANSSFTNSLSQANSLAFELVAYNLSVLYSTFIYNCQTQRSYSEDTSAILQGNVNYFIMKYCVLDRNFASMGLLFMTDQDFTIISFDNLHILHNFASYASGIYICTETTNKTIIWSNSLIYDSLDQPTMCVILYLYIPNVINNFDMRVINVTMANNIGEIYTIPNIERKTSYISVLWGYTQNIYMGFDNCIFQANIYINPFFSCYGIQPFLIFNLSNCIFINNNSTFIMITDHTMVGVTNVSFISNLFSLGHVMYSSATEASFINITFMDTIFLNFEIFLFSDYSNAYFENLVFYNVSCEKTVFMLINMNSSTISTVSITELLAFNIIVLENSTINTIENFYLENSTINSYGLYAQSSVIEEFQGFYCKNSLFMTLLSFQDLSISQNMSQLYCKYPDNSNGYTEIFLDIENSMTSIQGLYWNLSLSTLSSSQIIVISSNFSLDQAKIIGFQASDQTIYFLFISNSQIDLSNSIMRDFSNWISLENSIFSIENSTFLDSLDPSFTSPLFYFTNVISLDFSKSNFYRISSNSSPFLIENSLSALNILISNCVFYQCNALNSNGGAISTSDSIIIIQNNTFLRNSAIQGGALFLYCSIGTSCNYSIISNSFINNSAQIDGGAFKWKYFRPYETLNVYFNNYAAYSTDFSGFFCKIGFELEVFPYNNGTGKEVFSSFLSNSTDRLIISNVTSNSPMNNILTLYPLDSYNQIVYEQITNRIDLSVVLSDENYNNEDCVDNSINLFGKTSLFIDTTTQTFVFDYIIINACPNNTVMLNFSTNIIGLPMNLYEKANSLNENITGTYSLLIPIFIRPCLPGEIFNELANECDQIENYYSFSIYDSECQQCPLSAYCPGMNLIIIDENYWRISEKSAILYKCDENLNNCLGGLDSDCASDYIGPLCANCIGNKKKNFIGECKDCPDKFPNFMANCFFYLVLLIILAKVLEIIANNVSLSEKHKFLLVEFVHYMHLLFLTQKFNVNALKSSLELFLTFRSSMWFSLDCFLLMLTGTTDFYLNNFMKTLYYYWGFLVFLIGFNIFQRKREKINKMSFIKPLFFYFYCTFPYYLSFFFEQILCVEIENENYLISNTFISCDNSYYFNWAFVFFFPNIFLFIIIIPLIILFRYFDFSLDEYNKFRLRPQFFLELLRKIFIKSIKFDEFLRFSIKVILVIVRYTGLEDEDVNLVDFLILLTFFLMALKLERYSNEFYRVFSLYLLFIFLINCYFFVVLDFFYQYSLAIFFLILAIFLKLGYYVGTVFFFLSNRSFLTLISTEKIYMKRNTKDQKNIKAKNSKFRDQKFAPARNKKK